MRKVLGVIAGVVAAFAAVFVVESAGHMAFPPPSDTDLSDPAAMATLIDNIPIGAKLAVVVAWFVGALAGAWTAVTIARWTAAGWIVVALVVAAGVATLFQIQHPLWMQVAAVALPLLAGWVALRLSRPAQITGDVT